MKPFQFNDRFFQRGQTWRECLETWEPERDAFLRRASLKPLLQQSLSALVHHHKGRRFAVLYHFASIDSAIALPALGATFTRVDHIEVRFFNLAYFFPVLNPHFGRKVPQILALNHDGFCIDKWGPRPPEVAALIADEDPEKRGDLDAKLRAFPPEAFLEALDQSVYDFIHKIPATQASVSN